MATVHREPNQVKWIGVRPGHNGEQVLINIDFNANQSLYTVGAGKLLLIFSWQVTMAANTAGLASLELRTAVPAVYYCLAYLRGALAHSGPSVSNTLWVPIEVPATYEIYLTTNQQIEGGVHGILIAV